MATFLVTWEIHVEAESHEDAVAQAFGMARDPESMATLYTATDVDTGVIEVIDAVPDEENFDG